MKLRSLAEFIDKFSRKGSIKVLFKYRGEEGLVEDERFKEIVGETR